MRIITDITDSSLSMQASANISPLKLEVITSHEELLNLEQDWDSLLAELAEPAPFCSHACISSWWSCFGEDARLHLVVGRRGGSLCGIAPLRLDRTSWYGLPVRRLGCLYNAHIQRMAFPVRDPDKAAFHDALWRHVLALKSNWDVVELNQFSRGSYTLQAMEANAKQAGLGFGYWTQGASPYLTLAGEWKDYLAGMRAHRRGALGRKMRRLGEEGALRLERVSQGDDIDTALEDGLRIEAMAWKGSQNTAIASQPATLRFYRELASRLRTKAGLALYFLSVGGKRIAFQYCLEAGSAIYLLKPGYDPAWYRFSPSELLIRLVLEEAYAANKTEYDFLGDSEDWKMQWASGTRVHDWLHIFADSLHGRLLYNLKVQLVPRLKRLPSWNELVKARGSA